MSAQFTVVAKRYIGSSMYVAASTPGYMYLVALPLQWRRLPGEVKELLWKNAPEGESYFIFEANMHYAGFRTVASTAPSAVCEDEWLVCYMEFSEERGLQFVKDLVGDVAK